MRYKTKRAAQKAAPKRKAPARRRKPLSAATKATLRRKAKNKKSVTYGMLAKVYRRGQGAFLTSGSRPGASMASWAMGRVNSFIRRGHPQDNDLRKRKKK